MSTASVVAEMVADVEEFLDAHARTDALSSLLTELGTLGEVAAPAPSAELARLLAGDPPASSEATRPGAEVVALAPRRSRRGVAAGLAAAAVAALAVTGAAAAANELPTGVQRVVAHLSEDYLPFAFPRPHGDPPAPDRDADAPSSDAPSGAGEEAGDGAVPGTKDAGKQGAGKQQKSTTGGTAAVPGGATGTRSSSDHAGGQGGSEQGGKPEETGQDKSQDKSQDKGQDKGQDGDGGDTGAGATDVPTAVPTATRTPRGHAGTGNSGKSSSAPRGSGTAAPQSTRASKPSRSSGGTAASEDSTDGDPALRRSAKSTGDVDGSTP